MHRNINPCRNLPLAVASGTLLFFFYAGVAQAATLQISPASGAHAVGDSFTLSVRVSSPDQAMNAASGVVNFPANLLQVTSISKSLSIMSLWVQEPSFSNIAGTVNFEGVVLNPGFTGSSGNVISITFKAKLAGTATLTIDSGSVLANDGNGTEILTGTSGGTVEISQSAAPLSAKAQEGPRLIITSSTHPDPTKSYHTAIVDLSWNIPEGTSAVRILYDKNPGTTPSVVYDPSINTKEIRPGNGTWYFHAQAKSANGWGPVSHFKFTVDPNAPEEIAPVLEATATAPEVVTKESPPQLADWVKYLLPVFLALPLLLLLAWYALYRRNTSRGRHGSRLRHAHELLHQEFQDLQDAINEEVVALERIRLKRDLTVEEERFIARFKKMLDKTERVIDKEIDNV